MGTESGRLIRHDTVNGAVEEVRGRLGTGRLDNAVWRIYADPHTHAALAILRNADGYIAHGTGPVRPRWLAKLRGLRCTSGTWLRIQQQNGDRSVMLLGTAFGALFSLTVNSKNEKDDTLTLLWNVPNGERIDGIRVEQVAAKFVATVATTSVLYLFSDALQLSELFTEDRVSVVSRADAASPMPAAKLDQHTDNEVLPSELQFMTGNSGVASRRFVWAGALGVTHAQLSVRRRRTNQTPDASKDTKRSTPSTVIASLADRDTIAWSVLKDTSDSAVPLSCNLSAFHVLVLYPGAVYAFNHISGRLTQRLALWSPGHGDLQKEQSGTWPLTTPQVARTPPSPRDAVTGVDNHSESRLLSSPASGFARDVLVDCLWIYTSDGEFARLVVSPEEQTEAWRAAKAMGRFDLAMALAPLVSSGLPDDTAIFQSREAVLEAQADHAAREGDWDVAAQLYAKTNRPVESVVLMIVEACWKPMRGGVVPSSGRFDLRDLGVGARLVTVKHVITYLVRKLDRMDSSKPMQRTILATILVQLYSSQLASETDETIREEVRKDFNNFLADWYRDLDIGTTLGILSKNGCHEEAWNSAVLSGDILVACDMSTRRGQVDQSLSLLKKDNVLNDADMLRQLVAELANGLAPVAPKRVANALSRSFHNEVRHSDHVAVAQGLVRVARVEPDVEKRKEAYVATTRYLFDLLYHWRGAGKPWGHGEGDEGRDGDAIRTWKKLVNFLFVLHAEFGDEIEARRSYDQLIAPHVGHGMSKGIEETLGVILRCAIVAGFQTLCIFLYQALGMHDTAVSLAVGIDIFEAEKLVSQLGPGAVSNRERRHLWCMVARASEDAVGVVERSKGVLHIEDVLNDMEAFESATERVKRAVANSLEEHKRLANLAKSEAVSALEVTSCLREDLEKARCWQNEEHAKQLRLSYRTFSCRHRIKVKERLNGEARECTLCGDRAIDSTDAPFDHGLSLPVKMSKTSAESGTTARSHSSYSPFTE